MECPSGPEMVSEGKLPKIEAGLDWVKTWEQQGRGQMTSRARNKSTP